MIKHLTIYGLNGSINVDSDFHPDVNIITGRNGSGKTSILKAIWYSISGNLEHLARELRFKLLRISGDGYTLEIDAEKEDNFIVIFKSEKVSFKEKFSNFDDIASSQRTIERNVEIASATGISLFLPTFRRIEGGFMTDGEQRLIRRRVGNKFETELVRANGISEQMTNISSNLTVRGHSFICSMSTHDLQRLFELKYAVVSRETSKYYKEFSEFIFKTVNKENNQSWITDEMALKSIEERANYFETMRKSLMAPFEIIQKQCDEILMHKGISLSGIHTLGDSGTAIDSKVLSAGEKQMLSFICYNAFNKRASIFIDEPELSLHVDWQRQLVPLLLSQGSGNQFIMATHSPFIYAKYRDRELNINNDRGHSTDDGLS